MPVQNKRLTLSVGIAAIAALALIVIKVSEARHVAWLHSATDNALEQYVPEHPDDVKARVRLGVMEVANKDPRGEVLLKKAADASPGDEAIWFAYVDAIENPEVALAQEETYLKVLPDSVKLRAALGRTGRSAKRTIPCRRTHKICWKGFGCVSRACRCLDAAPPGERSIRVSQIRDSLG